MTTVKKVCFFFKLLFKKKEWESREGRGRFRRRTDDKCYKKLQKRRKFKTLSVKPNRYVYSVWFLHLYFWWKTKHMCKNIGSIRNLCDRCHQCGLPKPRFFFWKNKKSNQTIICILNSLLLLWDDAYKWTPQDRSTTSTTTTHHTDAPARAGALSRCHLGHRDTPVGPGWHPRYTGAR